MAACKKKATGGKNCCIVDCTNYNSKNKAVSYMSFPKAGIDQFTDDWRCRLINAVSRADSKFNPNTHHICTAHFVIRDLLFHGEHVDL